MSGTMVLPQTVSLLMTLAHAAKTNATQILRIWPATCSHISVQGLWSSWAHTDLSKVCCLLVPWSCMGLCFGQGFVWVNGSAATRVCIDVCESYCHRKWQHEWFSIRDSFWVLMFTSHFSNGTSSILVLFKTCACCHSHCELIRVSILLWPIEFPCWFCFLGILHPPPPGCYMFSTFSAA